MEGKRIRKLDDRREPPRTPRPPQPAGEDESLPMILEFERDGMGIAAKE